MFYVFKFFWRAPQSFNSFKSPNYLNRHTKTYQQFYSMGKSVENVDMWDGVEVSVG